MNKNVLNRIYTIATILGFAADTITIFSLLVAFDLKGINITIIFSNMQLTRFHLLGLWVIAFFTYIGFLNLYQNKFKNAFREHFQNIIFYDLIISSNKPFLLFPLIILFLLLLWITGWKIVLIIVGILLFIELMALFGGEEILIKAYRKKRAKFFTLKNWKYLDKRIEIELSRYQWIDCSRLYDIASIWKVEGRNLNYLLASYANLHPTKAIYGSIYDRKSNKLVSSDVLVSIKTIDFKSYFYA